MTLKELSWYFDIQERLARNKEILVSLEAAASPKGQMLTGMPHAPGVSDKVGDLAIEIADMKTRIQYLQEEAERQREPIERFIAGIENDQTRMIFRLRFLRCLTWGEVAAVIGGRNTENGVKSACYRYLANCSPE